MKFYEHLSHLAGYPAHKHSRKEHELLPLDVHLHDDVPLLDLVPPVQRLQSPGRWGVARSCPVSGEHLLLNELDQVDDCYRVLPKLLRVIYPVIPLPFAPLAVDDVGAELRVFPGAGKPFSGVAQCCVHLPLMSDRGAWENEGAPPELVVPFRDRLRVERCM